MEPTFDCIVDWLSGKQCLRVRVHSEPLLRKFASFGILNRTVFAYATTATSQNQKAHDGKPILYLVTKTNTAFLNHNRVVS